MPACGRPSATSARGRLEHRRDGGLVVGAEDRPGRVADDAVLDDRLDRPLRRHRVEVRAEEERRAAGAASARAGREVAGVEPIRRPRRPRRRRARARRGSASTRSATRALLARRVGSAASSGKRSSDVGLDRTWHGDRMSSRALDHRDERLAAARPGSLVGEAIEHGPSLVLVADDDAATSQSTAAPASARLQREELLAMTVADVAGSGSTAEFDSWSPGPGARGWRTIRSQGRLELTLRYRAGGQIAGLTSTSRSAGRGRGQRAATATPRARASARAPRRRTRGRAAPAASAAT